MKALRRCAFPWGLEISRNALCFPCLIRVFFSQFSMPDSLRPSARGRFTAFLVIYYSHHEWLGLSILNGNNGHMASKKSVLRIIVTAMLKTGCGIQIHVKKAFIIVGAHYFLEERNFSVSPSHEPFSFPECVPAMTIIVEGIMRNTRESIYPSAALYGICAPRVTRCAP